ncbi:hypothetical protein GT755_12395 [Herbidospora sp. NEAU-GS84]|uniref:Uncharacterized protein n=1 Tax=Herbidospora solisilvae TaxID=2696284 RepID=A0A7C9J276_9ACTN|nr:hypothetical protein [Herbidospora solisilvae]NAS22482.1 hypothetical protein [Herbidospora solisilvae]
MLKPLAKYQLALELAGHDPFESGREPYRRADILIKLRNWLVHYKPNSQPLDKGHEVGKHLKPSDFTANQLSTARHQWFPDRVLGAGCADWAWRSARTFTDEFAKRTGLVLNYQRADFGDPLPR